MSTKSCFSVLSDSVPMVKKIMLKTSSSSSNSGVSTSKTQCKCLCQYNVTESELLEAIKELQKNRAQKLKENKNL